MSFFDRVRRALRREQEEVSDAWRDLEGRLDADLSRRERELTETPEERLARLQREIDEAGDPFAEARARIERLRTGEPGPPSPAVDDEPPPSGAGGPAGSP